MSFEVSPLLSPLGIAQVTYEFDPITFFAAAWLAARQITHETGRRWRLNGGRSDRLYLSLSPQDLARCGGNVTQVDVESGLILDSTTATLQVQTRLASTFRLFTEFTDRLDSLLPRSR